jgi:hypothetical protein
MPTLSKAWDRFVGSTTEGWLLMGRSVDRWANWPGWPAHFVFFSFSLFLFLFICFFYKRSFIASI